MAQREKGDGFYDRIKKQKSLLWEKESAAYDEMDALRDAFQKAATPAEKEDLQKKKDAAWELSRELNRQSRELEEQEKNPPWAELSKQLLYANYAKVEELTRDGKLIKLANEELVPLLAQPAYAGDEKIAELLIARGANVNLPGHDNLTPLLFSVMKDNASIFKKLLKAGADISAHTDQGDGVRELAKYNGAENVLKFLKAMDRKTKKPVKTSKPAR